MRSSELSLEKYNTDKIKSCYLERYDPILMTWVDKKINLLELGIHEGGSLMLWRDYFPNGKIVGVDIKLPKEFKPTERIHLFEGSQADTKFLSSVSQEMAPEGFDIIIDDASHLGELTKKAFWHLFDNHLKPGGLYVIEDWGASYWDDWSDGKTLDLSSYNQPEFTISWIWLTLGKLGLKIPFRNHSYGMVGFVKQLVDEQAAADVTKERLTGAIKRNSKFESMIIKPGLVFIKKV